MNKLLRHAERSIALKLIIAIGILIITGSLVFWLAVSYKQKMDVISIAVKYGVSFIDYIKERNRHSMLSSHRHDIQQTLEDVSTAEGVERVRIFNHKGQIIYSTYKKEIGNPVDLESFACTGCHSSAAALSELLEQPPKWDIYTQKHSHCGFSQHISNCSVCVCVFIHLSVCLSVLALVSIEYCRSQTLVL